METRTCPHCRAGERARLTCEGCDRTGLVGDCVRCIGATPAPELDRRGGMCGPCDREQELSDRCRDEAIESAWLERLAS